MVFRKRYNRRYKKRRSYKKRSLRFKSRRGYRRSYKKKFRRMRRQLMPLHKIVKMKYVENVSITTAGVGLVSFGAFRANSIYDPNYSGAGHQAFLRDEYATFYKEYCVIGAKCTVRPIRSTSLTAEVWYDVYLTEDIVNTPSDLTTLAESKSNPGIAGNWIHDYLMSRKAFYSPKKWFRQKIMAEDGKWTDMSTNPAWNIYFIVVAGGPSGAITQAFTITIDYTVALRDRYEKNQWS